MPSRRTLLSLLATGLSGLAGCASGPSAPTTTAPRSTPTRTLPGTTERPPDTTAEPTEPATEPPGELDDWSFAWERHFDYEHVLALDVADGTLYATLSDEGGPSAVAAIDPEAPAVVWDATFEGEAVDGSHAGYRPIARDGWGVTVAGDTVYAVTGHADAYDWTAVHAVDRAAGVTRWSFRKPRRFTVHGVQSGLVVASGREFFEPDTTHDTPEEPLTSIVYGLDAADGSVRWSTSFQGLRDVGVGPDGVHVAAGSRLTGLRLDGTTRFTYEGEGRPVRAVRAAPGRIYYLTEAGGDRSVVHGLDPDGDRAWRVELPVDEVLLDGDRLYAGGDSVVALEADGTVSWRVDDGYGQWLLLGPARETLFTRAGVAQDRAAAYDAADGSLRWTYRPPTLSSPNAWPVAATPETAVVEGITADHASEAFTSLFAVDRSTGTGTRSLGVDPLFDVASVGGTVVVAGSSLLALEP